MSRAFLIGSAALIAVLAVGCGGSDESNPQVDAITRAYNTYIEAVKSGDGRAACAQLTPAYRRRASTVVTPREKAKLKGVSCPKAITNGTLRTVLQEFEPNLEQVEVTGDKASGIQPAVDPFLPQKVIFRRLGGDWKISATLYQRRAPPGEQG